MSKAVSSSNTKRGGRYAWAAAALCTALGAGIPVAQAQVCTEAACPPNFTIASRPLQKVPSVFKFQSRVSQAKIPLGDARLSLVKVRVKRANGELKCTETLTNVMVRDSVLNVELGRAMDCVLDEVIAQNNDLSFEVCIGENENCLKPVSLGTVPQSVKSSFAAQAQESLRAQISAQSHYTHRITPDANLMTNGGSLSAGYYEFQTPTTANLQGSLGSTVTGGYLQWTPKSGLATDNNLHVAMGENNAGVRVLKDLNEFHVHAATTDVKGRLIVRGGVSAEQPPLTAGVIPPALVSRGKTELSPPTDSGSAAYALTVNPALPVLTSQLTGAHPSGLTVKGESTFFHRVIFEETPLFRKGAPVAANTVTTDAIVDNQVKPFDVYFGINRGAFFFTADSPVSATTHTAVNLIQSSGDALGRDICFPTHVQIQTDGGYCSVTPITGTIGTVTDAILRFEGRAFRAFCKFLCI